MVTIALYTFLQAVNESTHHTMSHVQGDFLQGFSYSFLKVCQLCSVRLVVAQSVFYRGGTSDHHGWYPARNEATSLKLRHAWQQNDEDFEWVLESFLHSRRGPLWPWTSWTFPLQANAVVRKWFTHIAIVRWSGTLSWRPSLKWRQKILWTLIGDSLLFKLVSTAKEQCSAVHNCKWQFFPRWFYIFMSHRLRQCLHTTWLKSGYSFCATL